MFKKISLRLAFTYCLIFAVAITTIDATLILLYRYQQYKNTETVYGKIADLVWANRNLKLSTFLNMKSEEANKNLNGRVLLLDVKKKVIVDSLKQFEGQRIENPEVRNTLSRQKTSIGYYHMNGKQMAMLAYPAFKNKVFSGIVLISYYVGEEDIRKEVLSFTYQVVGISLIILVIVFMVSLYYGVRIAKPIKRLTEASLQILKGKIGTTVDIHSKDELGTFAKTFNMMSEELFHIDVGRKRFVSSVSHELKTPLASIKALIEPFIGEEKVDTAQLNEHLMDIDFEIGRLSSLTKSLLSLTRLEELKPLIEDIKLCEELKGILKILTPLASEKAIFMDYQCNTDIMVSADRSMLKEVLLNLADNAVKYGKQGGSVLICVQRCGDNVEIAVCDNGQGIDEKDIPYIFDNFYMADEARSSGKGSGIGLYIVKRIVEINGWKLRVKSRLGEGSEFSLCISLNHP